MEHLHTFTDIKKIIKNTAKAKEKISFFSITGILKNKPTKFFINIEVNTPSVSRKIWFKYLIEINTNNDSQENVIILSGKTFDSIYEKLSFELNKIKFKDKKIIKPIQNIQNNKIELTLDTLEKIEERNDGILSDDVKKRINKMFVITINTMLGKWFFTHAKELGSKIETTWKFDFEAKIAFVINDKNQNSNNWVQEYRQLIDKAFINKGRRIFSEKLELEFDKEMINKMSINLSPTEPIFPQDKTFDNYNKSTIWFIFTVSLSILK